MKDEWYADKRDLVKWGVLLHLADRYNAETIIQVAYYRASTWADLELDGRHLPIPEPVLDHFRRIGNIEHIDARPKIEVLDTPFRDRRKYAEALSNRLAQDDDAKRIVFLDPDTGLEPQARAGYEHVLESELRDIWAATRAQDVLVLYQHQTNRRGDPWIEPKRVQFEKVLGLAAGKAKLAYAPAVANDVAFFFSQKPDHVAP